MAGLEAVGLALTAIDVGYKVIAAAINYGQKVKTARQHTESTQHDVEEIVQLLDSIHARAAKYKGSDGPVHQWMSLQDIDSCFSPLQRTKQDLATVLDLLSNVKLSKLEQLAWPRKLKKIELLMQSIAKQKAIFTEKVLVDTGFQTLETEQKVSNLIDMTKNISLQQTVKWLSHYDHTVFHQDACMERMENTGEWIFKLKEFKDWKSSACGLLWIHGSADSGKTILASSIISTLSIESEHDSAVAYFYIKDGERQRASDILRCIVRQLYLKMPNVPKEAASQIEVWHSIGEKPSVPNLVSMISMLATAGINMYIVLDALDECIELAHLMKFLSSLMAQLPEYVHVLITSRKLGEISRAMENLTHKQIQLGSTSRVLTGLFPSMKDKLKGISDGISDDILLFVEKSLEDQHYLKIRSDDIKRKIKETLVDEADGMFRWVSCQIQQLSEPLSDEDLLSHLSNLPRDLDETYERMLTTTLNRKTSSIQASMVRNLLRWMVAAYNPVQTEVAVEAALQEPGCCSTDKRLPTIDAVLDICTGLIKKIQYLRDKSKLHIVFVHFSVKEYLLSDRIKCSRASYFALNEELAHRDIAQICLSYMFLFDQPDFKIAKVREAHPLLQQACLRWMDHLNDGRGENHPPIKALLEKFFDLNRQRFYNMWFAMSPSFSRSCQVNFGSHLFHAIGTRNVELTRSLLEKGENPNGGAGNWGDPIGRAVGGANIEMVSLLLETGADVNLRVRKGASVLSLACEQDDTAMLDLILRNGGDPNLGGFLRPLYVACRHENASAVHRLLDKGVNYKNFRDGLEITAKIGNENIFNMLVNCKAFQDSKDVVMLSSALFSACGKGSMAMCKRLIEEGANVNLTEYEGCRVGFQMICIDTSVDTTLMYGVETRKFMYKHGSVLKLAAYCGFDNIVALFLENGANIECCAGKLGKTPLFYGVQGHRLSTVKLLLRQDADKHGAKGGASPFDTAVNFGFVDIIKIFINHGIDYEREGGRYGDFLLSPMIRKREDVLELFLDDKDRTKPLYEKFGSLLYGAVLINDEELVLAALADGEDINIEVDSDTPLLLAVRKENLPMARLLLEKGANVHYKSTSYGTSIYQTATDGNTGKICKLLLEYGAELNSQQGEDGRPLQAVLEWNGKNCAERLLDLGADVNIGGGKLGSPLLIAVRRESYGTIELLLERGATLDCQDGKFHTVTRDQSPFNAITADPIQINPGPDFIQYPVLSFPTAQLRMRYDPFLIVNSRVVYNASGGTMYSPENPTHLQVADYARKVEIKGFLRNFVQVFESDNMLEILVCFARCRSTWGIFIQVIIKVIYHTFGFGIFICFNPVIFEYSPVYSFHPY